MSGIIILGSTQSGKTSLLIAAAYAAKRRITSLHSPEASGFKISLPDLSTLQRLETNAAPDASDGFNMALTGSDSFDFEEPQITKEVSADDLQKYFLNIPATVAPVPIPFILSASGRCGYRDVDGLIQDLPGSILQAMDNQEYEEYVSRLLRRADAVIIVLSMGEIPDNKTMAPTVRLLKLLLNDEFRHLSIALCLTKPDLSARSSSFRSDHVMDLLSHPRVMAAQLRNTIVELHQQDKDRIAIFKTFTFGYLSDELTQNVKIETGSGRYGFVDAAEVWHPYRVDEPFLWIYCKLTLRRLKEDEFGLLSRILVPDKFRMSLFKMRRCLFEVPPDLQLDNP